MKARTFKTLSYMPVGSVIRYTVGDKVKKWIVVEFSEGDYLNHVTIRPATILRRFIYFLISL